jgi:hypothetical protein
MYLNTLLSSTNAARIYILICFSYHLRIKLLSYKKVKFESPNLLRVINGQKPQNGTKRP